MRRDEQFLQPNPVHANNGDEARYPNKIGNSTKGLAHDSHTGEVIPAAYAALLAALRGGRSTDFDALASNGALGCSDPTRRRRFVNPQSAYAYDLEGIDSHQLTMPPAPAFASAQEASEMVELYWMALLRDVDFANYGTDPVAIAAAEDLSKLSDFRGPRSAEMSLRRRCFATSTRAAPPAPTSRSFSCSRSISAPSTSTRSILTNKAGVDFNTDFATWLNVINGCQPLPSSAIGSGPRVLLLTTVERSRSTSTWTFCTKRISSRA